MVNDSATSAEQHGVGFQQQPRPTAADPPDWAVAILNDAADGILTIAENGIVLWVNPAAVQLFGYSATEVVGQNVSMLMPEPDRSQHDSYLANYLRTAKKRIIGIGREVLGQRKDGSTFPMYLSVCESVVENRRVFGGIVRDLTRDRQVEDDLRRERDFSRRLLDTAEVIVLVVDARGRIVQFNEHLVRVTGRRFAELSEHNWIDAFVPESEQARVRWQFKQALGGRAARGCVCPISAHDGALRFVEWFNSPLDLGDGRASGLLCVGLDVTDRIEAEQQRHAYELKLRSLSAELTVTEERERQELAAELHDQIGQTLALAQIKLGTLQPAVPEEARAGLIEARELVGQAVRAGRSLMMELGATILHELGLAPALDTLAKDYQQRYGLHCRVLDDRQPKPISDAVKLALYRSVRELLMNVVKHADSKHADVELRRSGAMIQILVRDGGLGFDVPPGGFQANDQGGFGLFSIQERLNHLGGSMRLHSTPGAGTTVTIEAPLYEPSTGGQ